MVFKVNSSAVQYTDEHIISEYAYNTTEVQRNAQDGSLSITPTTKKYTFKTERRVPKVGLMLVGWGGNNGTTLTAGILANKKKLTWNTKTGT